MSQTTLKPAGTRQPVTLVSILDDSGCLFAAAEISGGATPAQILVFARTCWDDNGGPCAECERAAGILEGWQAGTQAQAA